MLFEFVFYDGESIFLYSTIDMKEEKDVSLCLSCPHVHLMPTSWEGGYKGEFFFKQGYVFLDFFLGYVGTSAINDDDFKISF